MNRILNKLIIVSFCVLMTQTACRAKKQAVTPPPVVKKDTTAVTAYDLLKSTIKPWTYFSSKINALKLCYLLKTAKIVLHSRCT